MTDTAVEPRPVRRALAGLVATPVRQFQFIAMATVGVASWLIIAVHMFRAVLPRDGLEGTLADVTAGEFPERWHSFYVAVLVWGHIPVLFLLACWGAVLGVRATVRAWREEDPGDPLSLDRLPGQLPAILLFWGSLVLGSFAFHAAGNSPMTGPAPFWNEYLGVTAWVTVMWWAVALLALGGTIARAVRRRRHWRERERRRQAGRVAAAERRAAAKEARRMGKQQ